MSTRWMTVRTVVMLAVAVVAPRSSSADPFELTTRCVPIDVRSGVFHRSFGDDVERALTEPAFRRSFTVPDAAWVMLDLGETSLGSRSHVVVTSDTDGSWQRLNAQTLEEWSRRSAFLNGSDVTVELFVAPGDIDVMLDVPQALIGERDPEARTRSLLCPDDRVASSDPRVGRLLRLPPASVSVCDTADAGSCTAFILPNGGLATAGHCHEPGILVPTVLQMNVPIDGSHPSCNDQYVVNRATIQWIDGLVIFAGDWAQFVVFPNPNTGRRPGGAQNAFFRLADPADLSTASNDIEARGYGIDTHYAGLPGQQNSSGYFTRVAAGHFEHGAATDNGLSGGPVIDQAYGAAVGIHAEHSCPGFWLGLGNSFVKAELHDAAQALPAGAAGCPSCNVVYVDHDHPVPGLGDILEPEDTISGAIYFALGTETVFAIAGGHYGENITAFAIPGARYILKAPANDVRIGTYAPRLPGVDSRAEAAGGKERVR